MNKVFCRKRLLFSFILTGYLIIFNTACGLDTFYELNAPYNDVHKPDCSSIDYTESYFEFFSAPEPDDGVPLKFFGTDVYYKIYNSSSQLRSEVDAIQSIANRDNSNAAATAMIEGNYKYQRLRASGHTGANVLISEAGEKVYIRLSDYPLYPAQISIDGGTSIGIPVRLRDSSKTFNFKSAVSDSIPKDGEDDVKINGSSDSEWFVSMFAVAVGQDSSYSMYYSNVLYLGSVRIPVE